MIARVSWRSSAKITNSNFYSELGAWSSGVRFEHLLRQESPGIRCKLRGGGIDLFGGYLKAQGDPETVHRPHFINFENIKAD